jgi:peptidyl-tRNA hydrolase, PTH1 family
MKIIIGLGNPGKEYEKTRHNIGFIFLDRIKETYKFPDFNFENKFNAEISRDKTELTKNEDIMLVKPQAMMNNSSQTVKAIMDFYKLPLENLIVIHDDIDIEIGKYKISTDSGSAGHNGVQDIISKLGTQNFKRIRIGVANEKLRNQIDPMDFVLQKFSEEELGTLLNEVSEQILSEIGKLI